MKLSELKKVIKYKFDFADKEIDGTFYIELDQIKEKYLNQIEVTGISQEYVTCDFVNFLNSHKAEVKEYIVDNYYNSEFKSYLIKQLCESDDIIDDGGEAVYHFIKEDMDYFLRETRA